MSVLFAVLILLFLFDSWVDALNLKSFPDSPPALFADSFNQEKLRVSKNYFAENLRLDLFRRGFVLVILFCAAWGGLFQSFDLFIREQVGTGLWHGIAFLGGISVISRILTMPFHVYDTFSIETRYGFNRMNAKTFVSDQLKGALLAFILGLPLLIAVLYFFETFGQNAWWMVWLITFAFQLLIVFIAPVFIFPIFNKFQPLENGPLKESVEAFAKKENFALAGLFKMDGSRRSTKSNAYFTGFGKTRRIVLFDTLIEKLTTDELTAVLAHEIGHYKLGHIVRMLIFSAVGSFVMLAILGALLGVEGMQTWVGVEQTSIAVSLFVLSFCFSPISRFTGMLGSWVSRKHEFEADQYASKSHGKPAALASALKKLSVDHLAHLTPHWLKVWLEYSHPPVLDRMNKLGIK